jgi:hypothetical protein
MHQRLMKAKTEDPQSAERSIGRLTPHVREILAERDSETRSLRIEAFNRLWDVFDAMKEYRGFSKAGDEAGKTQSVQRLRGLFGAQLDTQVKLHEREIAMLEERLAKLREVLAQQKTNRDAVIAKQIDRVTNGGPKPEPEKKN